jgi:pathogenesis-related protein 1
MAPLAVEETCGRILMAIALIAVVQLAGHVNGQSTTATDQSAYLDPHNSARSAVGVDAVVWNTTLEDYALNYAQSQTSQCSGGNLVHSGGPYGENLFWGSGGATWTPQDAVNDWVSEKQYYDYSSNSCVGGQECRHYTQVVWSTTTSIGCASVTCTGDASTYIICSYNPRGNYNGERPY